MEKRSRSFYVLATILRPLPRLFLYGPTITIAILSFQGPQGGLTFPMRGVSFTGSARTLPAAGGGRHLGQFRPFASCSA
jgi:ABC-type spermidine/putrescine transport system permease subunit II